MYDTFLLTERSQSIIERHEDNVVVHEQIGTAVHVTASHHEGPSVYVDDDVHLVLGIGSLSRDVHVDVQTVFLSLMSTSTYIFRPGENVLTDYTLKTRLNAIVLGVRIQDSIPVIRRFGFLDHDEEGTEAEAETLWKFSFHVQVKV